MQEGQHVIDQVELGDDTMFLAVGKVMDGYSIFATKSATFSPEVGLIAQVSFWMPSEDSVDITEFISGQVAKLNGQISKYFGSNPPEQQTWIEKVEAALMALRISTDPEIRVVSPD